MNLAPKIVLFDGGYWVPAVRIPVEERNVPVKHNLAYRL